jgi:hypothetical protein
MDIIKALAPAFAAGFAVQQLLEIVTSFLDLGDNTGFQKYKKPILGFIALVIGFSLSYGIGQLHVLTVLLTTVGADGKPLPPAPPVNDFLDALVTGLIISAGTEGINSILKFLKYTKEDKKNQAATKTPEAESATASATDGTTTKKTALGRMNQQ